MTMKNGDHATSATTSSKGMQLGGRRLQTRKRGLVCLVIVAFSISTLIRSRVASFLVPPLSSGDSTSSFDKEEQEQEDDDQSDEQRKNTASSSMCQSYLARTSAMTAWVTHITDIFNASRLLGDVSYKNHDLTAHILRLVTPRLSLSQRSFSRDFETIERVLQKAQARHEYLIMKQQQEMNNNGTLSEQEQEEPIPPPPVVQIVVLGGSVTMGVNCATGVRFWDNQKCAWPHRLETMLNALMLNALGGGAPGDSIDNNDIVKVHNMAIGGSNTRQGEAILRYDLLPAEARSPDILINAYSTNDMHVNTMNEAKGVNVTLRELIFDMAQDFTRTALLEDDEDASSSSSCNTNTKNQKRPLLLWLDDYVGNEQREILKTTELSQGIQVLSNYYGFGFVSYADVVRDLVYGDTKEALFSPNQWYKKKSPNVMSREIHPLQTMHMATSYVIAFNLLHLAATHCSLEAWNHVEYEQTMEYNKNNANVNASAANKATTDVPPGLPALRGTTASFPGMPRPRPLGLPPRLTPDLKLDDVSEKWRQQQAVAESGNPITACPVMDTNSTATVEQQQARCMFSWVSGMATDETLKTPQDIKTRFSTVIVEPTNWDYIDETGRNRKYGWQPNNNNNAVVAGESDEPQVFTMEFQTSLGQQPVRKIGFFYMQSYGENWVDSTAVADFAVRDATDPNNMSTWRRVANYTMQGFHNKMTSEMTNDEVILPEPTNNLRLSLTLASGKTFKLMGLVVCR